MSSRMAKLRLRYLNAFPDRHGKWRYYVRRPGVKAIPLDGNRASPDLDGQPEEFMQDYHLAAGVKMDRSKRIEGAPGTIGALIAAYLRAPEFRDLGEATKREYRRYIDRIAEAHSHRSVKKLTREKVLAIRDSFVDTPRVANWHVQLLKILMNFAVDRNWIEGSPAARVKLLKSRRRYEAWSDADMARFESAYPLGTRERLAYTLLLYAVQRRGDTANLTWPQYDGERLHVEQEKGGERVWITCPVPLKEVLDAAPREGVTILLTVNGTPFTSKNLGVWLTKKIRAAGIRKTVHGLRATGASALAEAGATTREIQSVTGHRTIRMIEHYTQDAERKKLAASAAKKRDRFVSRRAKPRET